MGMRLYATFTAAGLPAPQMIAAGRVESEPDSPAFDYFAATMQSLLPVTERLGIATAAEIDIDTLSQRLRVEAVNNGACITPPLLIGAWTREA